ncbi:MAG: purine-cytosine permease family protein [Opitutales bacterium]
MSSPSHEYEREPVPPKAHLRFRNFVGQYAGEHTAGTELMLGPLFVAAGVSAVDLIWGLLLGNLLAVLSWTFITAPIATRARLTLYFQLEQICGRRFVPLYNAVNGIMFCFLAGAMITVSATALGVWFGFPMPGLNDFWPNSLGWVLAVLGVGLVISTVAARGFALVSRVATYAAPWMVLIFIAFGLVGLRDFMNETNTTVRSFGDLWQLAETAIWTGGEPLPGQIKFTFWHVLFFGWFCNMAMHIGMSDLTILRFARKSWYGVASATGMYLGHFIAWISASILFALQLHRDPSQTDVLPGPMAASACGLAGLLCVLVAGWTTANPTIYRAGLAFQALMPRLPSARVIFFTGLVATVAGLFPAIAMKLLGFVALYGLALMPMGAVIFCDFWLMRRFGLEPAYAGKTGRTLAWPPMAAWIVTLALCLWLVHAGYIGLYFVSLPGWFVAAGLYLLFSHLFQQRSSAAPQPA